jgi:hypothetical protein
MNLWLFVIQVDKILDFTLTRTEKQYNNISRLLTEREARSYKMFITVMAEKELFYVEKNRSGNPVRTAWFRSFRKPTWCLQFNPDIWACHIRNVNTADQCINWNMTTIKHWLTSIYVAIMINWTQCK